MQRIQLGAVPNSTPSPVDSIQVEESVISVSEHRGGRHTLFVPLHYEPNYAYPLMVWLHGPGDDERQLQRIMPEVSLRNFAAIAPRSGTAVDTGRGFHWRQTSGDIAAATDSIFECIAVAQKRFHVSSQRIFLCGYDSGGTMALRIALNHPQKFAGAASIGGAFPQGSSPLLQLNGARKLPLLIAQGRQATKYSVDTTCEELRLFHAAGMSVSLRQYPGGDELTTGMLRDLNLWIMEQVTGVQMFDSHDAGDPSAQDSPN
ncbi:alpha/beta hydrolase [Lignipirellula cremea]|uniref:Phospholipase/Carboxylesterase n=1 Tax=Lignipirellula cremea TaxID=2528010 RepID=A0A518DX83_9BACT|nr:alpha/beta hydrolase-fold protein [Lignipirellula cremea]QDU96439.1 Phospholipase/Carboxylesterase [Lignipirellula cremea]